MMDIDVLTVSVKRLEHSRNRLKQMMNYYEERRNEETARGDDGGATHYTRCFKEVRLAWIAVHTLIRQLKEIELGTWEQQHELD